MKSESSNTCVIKDSISVNIDDDSEHFDIVIGHITLNCQATFELTREGTSGPLEMVIHISAKERAKLRRKTLKNTRWHALRKAFQ